MTNIITSRTMRNAGGLHFINDISQIDEMIKNQGKRKDMLGSILTDLSNDSKTKRDFDIQIKDLVFKPNGKLTTQRALLNNTGTEMGLTDWALSQYSQRMNIPPKYSKFLSTENPSLLAKNMNEMKSTLIRNGGLSDDKWMLLRTRVSNNKPNLLRGFLTQSYTPLDNLELVNIVYDIANQLGGVPQIFRNDDRYLFLRLIVPEMSYTVKRPDGKEDTFYTLINIWNSEVGYSSVRLSVGLFRLVCSNGMMKLETGDEFTKIHRFGTSMMLQSDIKSFIETSSNGLSDLVDMYTESATINVENPIDKIKKLSKKYKLRKIDTNNIVNAYDMEPMNNVYGIINAFTRGAQFGTKNNPEIREEIERVAYSILQEMIA